MSPLEKLLKKSTSGHSLEEIFPTPMPKGHILENEITFN